MTKHGVINKGIFTLGNEDKYLEDNGFYTVNRVFGIDKDDITISDIVSAIKRFNQDPAEVYQSVLDQLRHNKKRFYEFAKEQKKIFDL